MTNHLLRRLALTALALAIVVATALLFLEPDRGQSRGSAVFLSRSPGASLKMERGRARLLLDAPGEAPHAVTLAWPGGRLADPVADGLLTGVVNYLNGRDGRQRVRSVPTYRHVRYDQVYPGIDLVFYGNSRPIEYDFLVAPDADPSVITLAFDGIDEVTIDAASGDLLLHAKGRQIRQHAPMAYQDDPVRIAVDARYRINDDGTVGLTLGPWNRSRPLVIDPALDWSTDPGGRGDDWVQGAAPSPARAPPGGGGRH